jgi:hypothetical protein
MSEHLPSPELAVLHRLVSRARSAASGVLWRQAGQRRATRTATLIRLLPRVVPGRRVARSKVALGWVISTEPSVAVLTVGVRAGRTVEELTAPVPVRVHRPDLVDLDLLARLHAAGLVHLEVEEPQ